MVEREKITAGQAVYTPLTLRFYDWFVLGFSNRFLWCCATSHLKQMYDRNVSANHLDVGVGTGFFLDRARWPVANPLITLVDLNPHSLDLASRRIARYSPTTIIADVFNPLPMSQTFDSVGLCYLLHCLPGSLSEKAQVFDMVKPLMNDGARVFGATILQGDAPRSRTAQKLMDFYNAKGVFSNVNDECSVLECELSVRFRDVVIKRNGAVAIFEARK